MNNTKSDNESIFSTLGLALSFITAVSPIFVNSKISELFIDKTLVTPSSFAALIFGVLIAWLCINFFPFIWIPTMKKKDGNSRYVGQRHVVLFMILASFTAFIIFFAVNQRLVQAASYILFFDSLIAGFSLLISFSRATANNRYETENLPYRTVNLLEKNGVISTNVTIEINSPIGDDILNLLSIQHFGGARYVRVSEGGKVIDTILSLDARELLYVIKPADQEVLKKNNIKIGQI